MPFTHWQTLENVVYIHGLMVKTLTHSIDVDSWYSNGIDNTHGIDSDSWYSIGASMLLCRLFLNVCMRPSVEGAPLPSNINEDFCSPFTVLPAAVLSCAYFV